MPRSRAIASRDFKSANGKQIFIPLTPQSAKSFPPLGESEGGFTFFKIHINATRQGG